MKKFEMAEIMVEEFSVCETITASEIINPGENQTPLL